MARNICVIPVRMGSSRFPGKPLEHIHGIPMVLHIANRCRLSDKLDDVIVATCDREIQEVVEAYGIAVVMTRDDHDRCTDRVYEVITKPQFKLEDDDLVVMVQGDEIMVTPDMLDRVVDAYIKTKAPVINIVSRLYKETDYTDPNVVKVVGAPDGRALYFSRSPIPSSYRSKNPPMYQQTGIIAMTVSFLCSFGELPQTPLEKIESVDMLRTVEHGYNLQLLHIEEETIGIDSPADLMRAELMLVNDPHMKNIYNHLIKMVLCKKNTYHFFSIYGIRGIKFSNLTTTSFH